MWKPVESLLREEDPLAHLDRLVWTELTTAAGNPNHPWNLPSLATASTASGRLEAHSRTVVLRSVWRESHALACHTDVRSGKVAHLTEHPDSTASWLFYDATAKVQLRLCGSTEVIDGADADRAWPDVPLASRGAYLSLESPASPASGRLPPSTDDRQVTLEDSERGRAHFRIIRTTVESADLLYLRREGHVRAQVSYVAATPNPTWCWVVP